ncbi:hypothetical protein TELCIR_20844 [Teladorsagia circumcincta]|uniref:Uncharacterized protein n=1 Tax=Teladorsagia circumcincta TaxID=45464 RepID=A0A2G9TIE2_TELCI|nr:hypothetical protein TELCIR_20844 [Teladorsagia circumcincta]
MQTAGPYPADGIREHRLRWYEHELPLIRTTMDFEVRAKQLRGSPKERWRDVVKKCFTEPNDTFEFTIRPLDGGRPMIDLFWMYSSQNESWVGGTAGDGSKYKYTYPRGECFCHVVHTSDLNGSSQTWTTSTK